MKIHKLCIFFHERLFRSRSRVMRSSPISTGPLKSVLTVDNNFSRSNLGGAKCVNIRQRTFASEATLGSRVLLGTPERWRHRSLLCAHTQDSLVTIATASAAIPSPRPVIPRPSVVVALILTWATSIFRSAATFFRISSI